MNDDYKIVFNALIEKLESLKVLRKMWTMQEVIDIIRDFDKEHKP